MRVSHGTSANLALPDRVERPSAKRRRGLALGGIAGDDRVPPGPWPLTCTAHSFLRK